MTSDKTFTVCESQSVNIHIIGASQSVTNTALGCVSLKFILVVNSCLQLQKLTKNLKYYSIEFLSIRS